MDRPLDGDRVEYRNGGFYREGVGITVAEAREAAVLGITGAQDALDAARRHQRLLPGAARADSVCGGRMLLVSQDDLIDFARQVQAAVITTLVTVYGFSVDSKGAEALGQGLADFLQQHEGWLRERGEGISALYPLRRHLEEVLEEAVRQDHKVKDDPPALWQPDRHGVRMFLTSLEDEIREARDAWDDEKKPPGEPDPARWPETRAELVQVAAIAVRVIRSLSPEVPRQAVSAPDRSVFSPAEAEAIADCISVTERMGTSYEFYGGVEIAPAVTLARQALDRLAPGAGETQVEDRRV